MRGCPKRRAKRALSAIDGVKYAASPLPVGVNKIKNVLLGQPLKRNVEETASLEMSYIHLGALYG
jgi:hypothetical protein